MSGFLYQRAATDGYRSVGEYLVEDDSLLYTQVLLEALPLTMVAKCWAVNGPSTNWIIGWRKDPWFTRNVDRVLVGADGYL